MCVFINFWKLEIENSLLHVFSFLHKLSFENSFCFLSILGCQTSFLVSKIENCFRKHKIRGKGNYQTYPKFFFLKKKDTTFWLLGSSSKLVSYSYLYIYKIKSNTLLHMLSLSLSLNVFTPHSFEIISLFGWKTQKNGFSFW